ncbi:protein translocase SEC61 complex gamma subunit, archaeal and eukaryotic [Vittaforma corneae ATCC 50505]|uniref:Protein translocase SEC61 complex gamma subunit, archaeal and eukaryotic n=1 Tax=Vittaforma corneae (strain ATCC 50505) TaxID=993615 RepID=L2GK69_VITCO|nr:protein translocase SEC61 complex gamma subunit, archaeal and eukaryotic [Vittaforma corneae ATCC 50505]ELA41024.1 protein translocase SEC61 complex gamma subunit, archaeal and eukaryotic [Vittaforma corneae ATCC 50505]
MPSSSVSEVSRKEETPQAKKGCCNSIKRFLKNIRKFIRESEKPSHDQFRHILRGHLVGVIALGLFAYCIKVIHIPINNMIAGSEKK